MTGLSRRGALAAAAGTVAALAVPAPAGAAEEGPEQALAPTGRQFQLSAGRQRLVVTEVGATLRSWRIDGHELLLTHEAAELGDSHMGKVLLPWANRIDSATYSFDGVEYQTPISEHWSGHAIHGLVNWLPWTPAKQERDRIVLGCVLFPQYGYPFTLAFHLEYLLTAGGVQVTLTARNAGRQPAPFGAGYHPFLRVTPNVDVAGLTVPAETYLTNDDRLIPNGRAAVAGSAYDFRAQRLISSTRLDVCYTDLQRTDGVATATLETPDGHRIQVWADHTHRFLQVYTDDGAPANRPNRAGVAIEPMTCAPNAFNSGDGLIVLEPGQTYRGSWGLRSNRI